MVMTMLVARRLIKWLQLQAVLSLSSSSSSSSIVSDRDTEYEQPRTFFESFHLAAWRESRGWVSASASHFRRPP